MTNNPLNQVSQGESQTDENTKLQKRIAELSSEKKAKLQKELHELKVDQKLTEQSFHDSILSFFGYLAAGVVIWSVMHWQFGIIWPDQSDTPDEHLRVKDIWNVAMYVVPYCFWGMAIKHMSTLVITMLNFWYIEFASYRLKKKLAK
ncbi:hypothetical protein NTP67_21820 (plasmid) [Providencia rettgeri]|uniref:hypothetical protein n=1 Tax=Providencia rettgeri TaxID=587 RepID=UPI0022206173|nr:hypothetical protein [Providencia rettgeri]MDU7496167.1 hypothetical protein [Providencia rettgeri]UYV43807.1 hypothetical protein NTP67_21820 [Providencia rettgeri]